MNLKFQAVNMNSNTLLQEQEAAKTEEIPDLLIYEKVDSRPIYYRDYKRVLSGELNWEDSSRIGMFRVSLVFWHL